MDNKYWFISYTALDGPLAIRGNRAIVGSPAMWVFKRSKLWKHAIYLDCAVAITEDEFNILSKEYIGG